MKSCKIIDRVFIYVSEQLCTVEETADFINFFFANIGADNVGIEAEGPDQLYTIDPKPDSKLEYFAPINCEAFIEIIKEFKDSKSSGVKDISSKLILDAIFSIPDVFVKLFVEYRMAAMLAGWRGYCSADMPPVLLIDITIKNWSCMEYVYEGTRIIYHLADWTFSIPFLINQGWQFLKSLVWLPASLVAKRQTLTNTLSPV